MQTFKILSSHKSKIAGIAISGIGIGLMILSKILSNPIIDYRFSADQNFQLFLWIAFFGFYIMAFSREKNDDERVQLIRGKSMTIAFAALLGLVMSITLVGVIDPKLSLNVGTDMFLFSTFGLGVYLLHFNIGLYFDNVWNYAADDTLLNSLRKKKLFMIVYVAIGIGLLLLLKFL